MPDKPDTTPDVDALLAAARKPERTVAVCLRGDLQAEIDELERRITATVGDDRVADRGVAYADQIDALRDQMQAATLTLRLRGLGWRDWAALEAAHPPRKDDDGEPVGQDGDVGFDVDGLVAAAIPQSLIWPEMTPGQIDTMLDAITSAQYDEIAQTIFELNRHRVTVPFSVLASAARETSGENSKPPARGASPAAASTAGNRKPRSGTSTTSTAD